MDTRTCYRRGMPPQKWTPPTKEMADKIDRIVSLYLQQIQADAEYRTLLAEAHAEGAKVKYIAERLSEATGKAVERKAVYRHLGQRMP